MNAPRTRITTQSTPDSIKEIESLMQTLGFDLVEQTASEISFGDRRFRWKRHDLKIQLKLDRGCWFVDVIPPEQNGWSGYGLEIVIDTLDGANRFTHLLTAKEVAKTLGSRIGAISSLLSSPDGCEEIEQKQRERSRKWFGA